MNEARIGNCCIKKFFPLDTITLVRELRRVEKNIGKSFSAKVIQYFYETKKINQWERKFYMDIYRRRRLSFKQMEIKEDINRRIINCFFKREIQKGLDAWLSCQ